MYVLDVCHAMMANVAERYRVISVGEIIIHGYIKKGRGLDLVNHLVSLVLPCSIIGVNPLTKLIVVLA